MNSTIFWIVSFIFFIWLVGLSYLLLRTLANYNKLTRGVSKKTLSQILNQLLDQNSVTQKELTQINSEIKKVKKDALKHVQKVGLIRFNPFSDTGGHQSFVLAMLDREENGFVLTSLYARTGVRWYIKTIKRGRGLEHDLSKEEVEAVEKAIKTRVATKSKKG